MIILAAGMPRAGSGWHYNLVHDLVVANGGQDARLIRQFFLLFPILTAVNCNIRALSAKRLVPVLIPSRLGNTFAIKTHSGPTPIALRLMGEGQMKVTYVYRDPRAAMLSAYEYGQRSRGAGRRNAFTLLETMDTAIEFMLSYLQIWTEWMEVKSVHAMRYENLVSQYDAEAERLALFLGADPSDSDVREAIEFYRSDQGNQGGKGQHFQHGEAERFRTALTSAQLEAANKAFEPYLSKMGYEV
jgi:hypothetical protein